MKSAAETLVDTDTDIDGVVDVVLMELAVADGVLDVPSISTPMDTTMQKQSECCRRQTYRNTNRTCCRSPLDRDAELRLVEIDFVGDSEAAELNDMLADRLVDAVLDGEAPLDRDCEGFRFAMCSMKATPMMTH